jgi:hypothetical protein
VNRPTVGLIYFGADRKSFRFVVIRCQVERAVTIDEAKANTIQPAPSSENVLADRRLREEVDHGPRDHPEYVYFNFVAISIESCCSPFGIASIFHRLVRNPTRWHTHSQTGKMTLRCPRWRRDQLRLRRIEAQPVQ